MARDHGGPWQNTFEIEKKLSLSKAIESAKKSFYQAAVIDGSFVLDFESDCVKKDEARSGVLNGPFLKYTKREKDLITKKIINCYC